MQRDELSYCRICAAACGIVVTVDGDRVLRVRGDDDHPVSRGYTCSKGTRARGMAPLAATASIARGVHGREVSWDELLADLAPRLDAIIDSTGPDAVALYLATGLAYDAAGQIAASQWLPSIGSRSFLTAVTVDNAPVLVAAELVSGEPMLNPVWDPTVPGLAIFVGTNPVISHGYGTALPDPIRYLREYRARGGRVWVLDPRRTETAALADVYVPDATRRRRRRARRRSRTRCSSGAPTSTSCASTATRPRSRRCAPRSHASPSSGPPRPPTSIPRCSNSS